MLRATIKSLLARKLRLLLSALAIVLGVSFVSGAFVLTDSLGKTFDNLFGTVTKDLGAQVRGGVQSDFGDFDSDQTRAKVPTSVLATVKGVDGVAEANPTVSGPSVAVGTDGKPVSSDGAPNIGTNWSDAPSTQQKIVEGNPPRAPDEIAMDPDYAEKTKHHVGDSVTVLNRTGQQQYKLVGLARYLDGKSSLGGETYVFYPLATAQKVLDFPNSYETIDVVAKPGVSQTDLRDRLAAVLPKGTEAITGKQFADEQTSDIKDGLSFLNTFLLVFAAVALFVGAFIIFNTFSILVAQRTRELALMRALGASRRQVTRSVLFESVIVGLIASAVGLGLGIGVALGLKALFGAFGAGLPSGPTVILPRTVLAAFAVGVVVTAVAALVPARRAARIAPVAAMRDAAHVDRPLTRQTIGGSIILVLGAAAMAVGLTGHGLAILGIGTLLAFIGVALLSPLVSRPVTRLVGSLFARQIPGKLGRQNALRNPRRTASTAAALMIGLALVSAVGVLGASLNGSIKSVVNNALGADFVLNTQAAAITPEAMNAVKGTSGVAAVYGLRFDGIKVNGKRTDALATDPAAIGQTMSLDKRQGEITLGPGTLLMNDTLLTDNGWHVGQQLDVAFRDGKTEKLTIAGSYKRNELLGNYVLDQSASAHFQQHTLYQAAMVKLAAGANSGQVRTQLQAALKAYPNVELQDRSQFIKEATDQINQLVQFLTVLLVLSVLIAVLGIVNTLALSVLERTRELGLLRAVGMSRRQVKRMVRVESVVIAVFGGLLGLAVGAVFGIALQRALVDQGVTELLFPYVRLLAYLVLAAVAGVIAAWLPARRASRLNVLTAIAAD
jgi:putative ABC transport system permease protein